MNGGATPVVNEVTAIKETERLQKEKDFLGRNAPLGNDQHPETKRYREVQRLLKEGVKKTIYGLEESDGSTWTITKTEYDYANNKGKTKINWEQVGKGDTEKTGDFEGYSVSASRRFNHLREQVGADLSISKRNSDGTLSNPTIISEYKTISEAKKDASTK